MDFFETFYTYIVPNYSEVTKCVESRSLYCSIKFMASYTPFRHEITDTFKFSNFSRPFKNSGIIDHFNQVEGKEIKILIK